ncbi:MAG: hypothetical protein K0U59_07005 [Gammaproteobacteria bacterium]|nr:hypothetical protein [Gammaproteobacteria bacterium]
MSKEQFLFAGKITFITESPNGTGFSTTVQPVKQDTGIILNGCTLKGFKLSEGQKSD